MLSKVLRAAKLAAPLELPRAGMVGEPRCFPRIKPRVLSKSCLWVSRGGEASQERWDDALGHAAACPFGCSGCPWRGRCRGVMLPLCLHSSPAPFNPGLFCAGRAQHRRCPPC